MDNLNNEHCNNPREEVLTSLLESIALEEKGLADIIKSEAEKTKFILDEDRCCETSIGDIKEITKSVERILRCVIKKEMLLQFKLEDVSDLIPKPKPCEPCHHEHKHCIHNILCKCDCKCHNDNFLPLLLLIFFCNNNRSYCKPKKISNHCTCRHSKHNKH